MARVAAGDHPAFCVLVDRHFRRTLTVAERMMGRRADADEIAQEAFLRVWRSPEQYRPARGKFAAWLYRVTVNLCLDRLRRQPEMPLETAAETVDPAADAEHHVAAGEAARLVAEAVAALPGRQKAALILCYYEQFSNAEAATALSVSIAALEALLVRARRTLREKLKVLGNGQEENP